MSEEYVKQIIERNPRMADLDTQLRISSGELLRHIRRAFEAGQAATADAVRAADAFKQVENPFPDFLEAIFGMRR